MRMQQAWIPTLSLAVALGGLAFWRSQESGQARSSARDAAEVPVVPEPLSDALGMVAHRDDDLLSLDSAGAMHVDFDPLLDGGAVHANAVDEARPVPSQPAVDQSTPGALPNPRSAQPIDRQTAAVDRELEALIARELADLPEHQRTVWRDVLQGLAPKEAEEILQIWKLTGRISTAPKSPSWESMIPESAALVNPSHATQLPDEQLRVVRENLMHFETPGFIRTLPELAPVLDLTPGRLRETGNPLHLAINGLGFFVLTRGEQVAYTRNGRFDLNVDRQLVQVRSDGEWRLETNSIQAIPEEALRLVVTETGGVFAEQPHPSGELVPCGQVSPVAFLNPQHLQRLDGDLLTTTAKSGGPQVPKQGFIVRQGVLEESNATLEREAAVVDLWEQRALLLKRLGD